MIKKITLGLATILISASMYTVKAQTVEELTKENQELKNQIEYLEGLKENKLRKENEALKEDTTIYLNQIKVLESNNELIQKKYDAWKTDSIYCPITNENRHISESQSIINYLHDNYSKLNNLTLKYGDKTIPIHEAQTEFNIYDAENKKQIDHLNNIIDRIGLE